MYIGRYNQYYSFATVSNKGCTDGAGGKKQWGGEIKGGGIGFGTGSTCTAARADFCKKYGVNGKCYGDAGGPPANVSGKGNTYAGIQAAGGSVYKPDSKNTLKPITGNPPDSGGGSGSCTPRACPPPSVKTDVIGWWNMGACQFGNLTCHQLPDWGFTIVAGIGGIILLGLLTKRR